jgi:hypothetical protein
MRLSSATLVLATASLLVSACTGHDIKSVTLESEGVCTTGVNVEIVKPKIMLVLDKSGSMSAQTWDHDADPATAEATRWASLHGVVDELVENRQASVDFGAALFPSAEATGTITNACLMASEPEVGVAEYNHEAIMHAMPSADAEVQGGTPATAGIEQAVGHLLSLDTEDPRAMILVTDGAANCMAGTEEEEIATLYDEDLAGTVEDAHDVHGIPTYVIGIDIVDEMGTLPAANPFQSLNEVAIAGGQARDAEAMFYDVSNGEELEAALDEIATSLSCSIALDELPASNQHLALEVNGEDQHEVQDCTDGEGWRWAEAGSEGTIELCGDTCSRFQSSGDLRVDFLCE